jgi:hypothetical protein
MQVLVRHQSVTQIAKRRPLNELALARLLFRRSGEGDGHLYRARISSLKNIAHARGGAIANSKTVPLLPSGVEKNVWYKTLALF